MINRIFFKETLFIISLLLIQSCQPSDCPRGIPYDTTYMRRDENRCEGIMKEISISGGMEFISLTTSAITTFDEKLQLHIPKFNGSNLESVRSLAELYQLDKIKSFKPEASTLTFSWSTYVLKKKKIPPENLRALASYTGVSKVYLPVIIGKSSGEYQFVFNSTDTIENFTFQILNPNGKTVYTDSRKTPQIGEIIFKWKPKKAPKGRYQLMYKFKLEPNNKSSKGDKILFEHNPAWLQ